MFSGTSDSSYASSASSSSTPFVRQSGHGFRAWGLRRCPFARKEGDLVGVLEVKFCRFSTPG